MNRAALLTLVMLLVIVAGCTQRVERADGGDGQRTTRPSESSATATVTDSGAIENVPDPLSRFFVADGCNGFFTIHQWPANLGPDDPSLPDSWSPSVQLGSEVELDYFTCDRIGWGPYERPMTLMFELHSKFAMPAGCDAEGPALRWVLYGLWVSDAEFASFLKQEYQLPVRVGVFGYSQQMTGPIMTESWKWSEPGGPESRLEMFGEAMEYSQIAFWYRLAWFRDGGVGIMDLNISTESPDIYTHATVGEMKPPMLYASAGVEPYAADGGPQRAASLEGNLKIFRGDQCEES